MAAAAKWTAEQKQRALAMAEATCIREASQQTGVPEGSIKRWRSEANRTEPGEPSGPSKKIQAIAKEATEEVKAEVREYVADRAKLVADNIMTMVENAITEAEHTLKTGPNIDEPRAGWLRAVIGAIIKGVEKHQLLTGKPTGRVEGQVTQKYVYDITQRIIDDPVNRESARDLFRRAFSGSVDS